MLIASEMIADAALDGEAFAALPGLIARAVGARSAVIHWRSPVGDGEIVHSGHFSEADMALLDSHFAGHDLWADALARPAARNRAWCCHAAVPADVYASGRLYNDWIRAIGDDTVHGLGAVFDAGELVAEIGLHRGHRAGEFGDEARAAVDALLHPLRRTLRIRARLKEAHDGGALALAALDATRETVLVVSADGRLVHGNRAAEALLQAGDVLAVRSGRLGARSPTDDRVLARSLEAAGRHGLAGTVALTGRSGRRYSLTLDQMLVAGQRRVVIFVRWAAGVDAASAARVAALYGLSTTESAVAAAIGAGRSAQEIANDRGTSILTVRGQIKSVMGKMGVHRQSEVAAAVAALTGSTTH